MARVVPSNNGCEGNSRINQCFNGLNDNEAKSVTPKGVAIVGLQRLHFRMRWGVKLNEEMKVVKRVTLTDLRNNPEMFLTTGQVKQALGISDPTLYRWRKLQIVPCFKIGGAYKYLAADIINYINENKQ